MSNSKDLHRLISVIDRDVGQTNSTPQQAEMKLLKLFEQIDNLKDAIERRDKIKEEVVDCTTTLMQAVQEAGGTVNGEILNMSVSEFIATVAAQNHIRFAYAPSVEETKGC